MGVFEEYAEKFCEAGLSVIPCEGKVPVLKGWQRFSDEQMHPSELNACVNDYGHLNIGVVCGKASGLVLVDIDNPEMAKHIPPSPVSWQGRDGRETRAFKWNGEGVEHYAGVDIIGKGGFAVLPPSIHPDINRPYRWLNNALPYENLPLLVLDRKVLPKIQRDSSGEMIGEGRNNSLTKLSYALACDGAARNEIADKLLASEHASWFFDQTEPHRGKDPRGSAMVMAYKAIKSAVEKNERIGADVKIDVAGLIATEEKRKQEKVQEEVKVVSSREEYVKKYNPRPEDLYTPPPIPPEGAMNWLCRYNQSLSPTDIPSLSMGGAISKISALTQNRFRFGSTGLHTYVLNIAPSGTGKSFPYTAVDHIIPMELIGAGGYKSGKIITENLGIKRERVDVLDEVAAMFSHMKDGSSFQAEMVDTLCKLWSQSPETYYLANQSMSGKKEGERKGFWSPAVSILASTTHAGIIGSTNREMSEKGFFPRFLIFSQPELGWQGRAPLDEDLVAKIFKWRDLILSHDILLATQTNIAGNIQNSLTEPGDRRRLARNVCAFDEKYLDQLERKFFEQRKKLSHDDPLKSYHARKIEHVKKIALLYELGRIQEPIVSKLETINLKGGPHEVLNAINFVVKEDALEYGEKLMDWMFSSYQLHFISNMAEGSPKVRNSRDVLAFIKSYGPPGVSHSKVIHQYQRILRRDREEIIGDLLGSNQIRLIDVKTKGRPAKHYVATGEEP